jgi:hypothetical protein
VVYVIAATPPKEATTGTKFFPRWLAKKKYRRKQAAKKGVMTAKKSKAAA